MTRRGIFASVVVVLPALLLLTLDLRSFPSRGALGKIRAQTDLERLLEGVRPCEGRWTGLDYAPFQEGSLEELSRSSLFKRAVAKILRRAEKTPESIRDRALIEMISDDSDEAVRILEAGTENHPRDARIYNNLAITHLVRARVERDPYQLILALSAVRKAVVLNGSLLEAAFNHALILERLYLRTQSRRAWRRYLDLDQNSEWAREARIRLSSLERPVEDPIRTATAALRAGQLQQAREVVSRSTQPIRFHVENDLLPGWARAIEQGDLQSAKDSLGLAESLSSLLLERSGDRVLVGTIELIRRAEGETLRELATGHRLYGEGATLFGKGRFGEAKELFLSAKKQFMRTESPFVLWAQFSSALCDYQQSKVDAAINSALEIRESAEALGALNLMGRIDWMTGLVRLEGADPSSGLFYLRRALRIFQKTGEKSYEGAVASLVANSLAYLGAPDEAWSYHFLAVASTAQSGDKARLSAAYGSLVRSLLRKGQARAALVVQNEAVALDLQDNPVRNSEAFWWRSMILRELGKPMMALRDLEQAWVRCAAIPDEATRKRNMAGLLVTEGAIRTSLDPRLAVEMLTQALDLYKDSKYSYLLVDIYLERARALRRLSRTDVAETDLLAAIEEYEKQRGRVEGAKRRISFFSRAEDVFDEMVSFQIQGRGDLERGFEFSERSRAREALASAECSGDTRCSGRSLSLDKVLVSIPAQSTLLQYHILRDRLLIWSLREGNISLHQSKIDQHELESWIEEFVSAVRGHGGDERYLDASQKLYRVLLEPVEHDLAASNRVAIVPEGVLDRLPFPALRVPRSGHFLVDMLPTAIEPSSSLYVAAMQSAKQRPQRDLTSLAIGNPAFDRAANPYQADLPAAEREARSLAMRAPHSVLLSRKEATVARLFQEIHRHDIVHFGGHALVDRLVPGGSRLLLAKSKDQTGDLFGDQIQGLKLGRAKLLTLSACDTGSGVYRHLEGTSDLAKPFLVAGVPSVVISLWQVEDRESEAFWKFFYDSYFAGDGAGIALQKAQAAMRNSSHESLRAPRAWAGYRLVGDF